MIEAVILFSKEDFSGRRRSAKPLKKFASVILKRAAGDPSYDLQSAKNDFHSLVERDKNKLTWDFDKLKRAYKLFHRESAAKNKALSNISVKLEGHDLDWPTLLLEAAILFSPPEEIDVHKARGLRSFARQVLAQVTVEDGKDLESARRKFAILCGA